MNFTGMLKDGTLGNKTILITGGGTGLGKSMGSYILELGGKLVITSRKLESIQKTADEFNKKYPNSVLAITGDVRNVDDMEKLFKASSKYVIIYSSNTNTQFNSPTKHFKNRKFTKWVNEKQPDFKLIKFIKNKYPYKKLKKGSLSDFFIYQKL